MRKTRVPMHFLSLLVAPAILIVTGGAFFFTAVYFVDKFLFPSHLTQSFVSAVEQGEIARNAVDPTEMIKGPEATVLSIEMMNPSKVRSSYPTTNNDTREEKGHKTSETEVKPFFDKLVEPSEKLKPYKRVSESNGDDGAANVLNRNGVAAIYDDLKNESKVAPEVAASVLFETQHKSALGDDTTVPEIARSQATAIPNTDVSVDTSLESGVTTAKKLLPSIAGTTNLPMREFSGLKGGETSKNEVQAASTLESQQLHIATNEDTFRTLNYNHQYMNHSAEKTNSEPVPTLQLPKAKRALDLASTTPLNFPERLNAGSNNGTERAVIPGSLDVGVFGVTQKHKTSNLHIDLSFPSSQTPVSREKERAVMYDSVVGAALTSAETVLTDNDNKANQNVANLPPNFDGDTDIEYHVSNRTVPQSNTPNTVQKSIRPRIRDASHASKQDVQSPSKLGTSQSTSGLRIVGLFEISNKKWALLKTPAGELIKLQKGARINEVTLIDIANSSAIFQIGEDSRSFVMGEMLGQ